MEVLNVYFYKNFTKDLFAHFLCKDKEQALVGGYFNFRV